MNEKDRIPSSSSIEPNYIFIKANRIVVIPRVKKDTRNRYYHLVRCLGCGREKEVRHDRLREGRKCVCIEITVNEVSTGYISKSSNKVVLIPRARYKKGVAYHYVECLGCKRRKYMRHADLIADHKCKCSLISAKEVYVGYKFASESREVLEPRSRVVRYRRNKNTWYHTVKCLKCGVINEVQHRSLVEDCKCGNCFDSMMYDEYLLKLRSVNPMIKVIGEFENGTTKIAHRCIVCGRNDWMIAPVTVLAGKMMCSRCRDEVQDSILATTLKQWLSFKYNAILERNLGFKKNSLYDSVIEQRKEVVEVQSSYHNSKVEFDKLKREHAEALGYEVIYFHVDEHTPLEACRYFDENVTWDEICKVVDYSVLLREKIVQLDYEGNLVQIYDGGVMEAAFILGIKSSARLRLAVKGKNRKQEHAYGGYIWYLYKDYIKEDFVPQEMTEDTILRREKLRGIRIVQLDENFNLITTFDSILQASKALGISDSHISQVCRKHYGRKTAGGFNWMYEAEYLQMFIMIDG